MLFVSFVMASFLVRSCVSDEDPSYYMLESPETEEEIKPKRDFKVYWNVPTIQCRSKQVPFSDLNRFGIIQNTRDDFRQGDRIAILYDPGYFPAMFNSSPGVYRFRNGGVPQQGSIQKHLDALKISIDDLIPIKNYSGIAVINFESWKPIFLQNYGTLKPYIDVSYDIERKEHWWWPQSWIQSTAKERFERAARIFMESTIKLAKKMRPNATWGYYGYPYCYSRGVEQCNGKTTKENDELDWLWQECTGIFPSVYTSRGVSGGALRQTARGAVHEALRVNTHGAVLPYLSYVYRDQRHAYYTRTDLEILLDTIYNSNVDGVIVWGASSDVNTKQKCKKLWNYVTNVFGPTIAKFTKGDRPRALETTTSTTVATTTAALITSSTKANENTTLVNKPTTEKQAQASTEQSYHMNTTQIMENVSDFLETAKKVKQDTLSGEIILNSIIQFFNMTATNSTLNEATEMPEFTQNPDDTPGFTQNDSEQEIKPETNSLVSNNDDSICIKRKHITVPISLSIANVPILWKNMNGQAPKNSQFNNAKIKILTETKPASNKFEHYSKTETVSTVRNIIKITTDFTTQKIHTKPDQSLDNEKESNKILETLTKLTDDLDNHTSVETSQKNKNINNNNKDQVTTSKFLLDLTDDTNLEPNDEKYKNIIDDNPDNLRSYQDYDLEVSENIIDYPKDNKRSNNYHRQEELEDDIILEAVAEILNSTHRREIKKAR